MVSMYEFTEPLVVVGSEQFQIKIIKTPLNNIKPEKLLKPISQTSYSGINGGFYNGNYTSPPERSDSISWSYEDQGTGKKLRL